MTPNQQKAIELYDTASRGRCGFGISGDSMRDTRQAIMHLLTGVKMPKAQCGTNAVETAISRAKSEAAADPMAGEQETAQWYVVNSEMPEIRRIAADRHGYGWTLLGEAQRNNLRRELYRIRSEGEAIDRAAGRDPMTGETVPEARTTRFEQPGMMPEPTDAEKVEQIRNLTRKTSPLPSTAYQPHPFRVGNKWRCADCTLLEGAACHILPLPGMESADGARAEIEAAEQGQELTARMRQPLQDVSGMAGAIERESPLFFGTGDNPSLF